MGRFSPPNSMRKTRRPSVFAPSRRRVFLISLPPSSSTRDPQSPGILPLRSSLPQLLESSLLLDPRNTTERVFRLLRWMDLSTTSRNSYTLSPHLRTPTPSSTESSHRLCLPFLMLLDQITELVLCRLLPPLPSAAFTKRRLPLPRLRLKAPQGFFISQTVLPQNSIGNHLQI